MIAIDNIYKRFETVPALSQVSLTIADGELCGLLGPNGAGKSTLFKIIIGLLAADRGEIRFNGEEIVFGEVEYKRHVGYAPENPVLYDYLTGSEFLHFIAAAKAGSPHAASGRRPRHDEIREQIAHWLDFFELTAKAEELIKNYSNGMRRKISLCAALLGRPEILLLDEATNGLDPESSFRFKEFLREYCRAGGTVLFSSHIIETVEHLCDRIVILHHGRVLTEMPRPEWEELRQAGSSLEQRFITLLQESGSNLKQGI